MRLKSLDTADLIRIRETATVRDAKMGQIIKFWTLQVALRALPQWIVLWEFNDIVIYCPTDASRR
jgi:hypothetical protein